MFYSELSEEQKTEIRSEIQKSLIETYHCTRVWEAWSYGTMSEDDFEPAWLDVGFIDEIAESVFNKYATIKQQLKVEICAPLEGCNDSATLKFYKTKWSFCPHCGRKLSAI